MAASKGQLTVTLEGKVIQTVAVDKALLRIGRLPDNDVKLDAAAVSRHHAELRQEGEAVVLVDLDSANGTFIDGQRLAAHEPRRLQGGESFRIGPFTLTYQELPGAQAERVPLPPVSQPTQLSDAPTLTRTKPMTVSSRQVGWAPFAQTEREAREPLERADPACPSCYLKYLPACFQAPARQLPDSLRARDFLGRYLRIFEAIWEPLEQRQDQLHMYFDPRTCPPAFVRLLASWLDYDLNPTWSVERCRGLVYRAVELHRWSGTANLLKDNIKLWTDLDAAVETLPGFVFQVRVKLPADSPVDERLLEEIIQTSKPAPCGYILEIER